MEEALSARADDVGSRLQPGRRGNHISRDRKRGGRRQMRLRSFGTLVPGWAAAVHVRNAARVQAQFGGENCLR